MATSQNGWPASPNRLDIDVEPFEVVGAAAFPGGVRSGPVAAVLGYVARQVHARVEPLVDGWCWGHAYRDVTGTSGLSNHASGTAVDINAPEHPIGATGTFTAAQVREIHEILAEVGRGVVRWGGDYTGRRDEMHFEINANTTAVAAAAARLTTIEEDDVSYTDAFNAIRDYFGRQIVNPREDGKPGLTTTLATQLQFSDWRYVRTLNAVKDMIAPLYDDQEQAAAAFARVDAQLAELGDPLTPEQHAAALAETLPAAVLSALRQLLAEEAPNV